MFPEGEENPDPAVFITFASAPFAQVGNQFIHRGYQKQCPSCKLFFVCQKHLQKHQAYEIIEVRKKQHECPQKFHHDPLIVVKVQKLGKIVALPKKGTFPGVSATYTHQVCIVLECPHRPECASTTVLSEGKRVKVQNIVKEISGECRMGYELVLVDCDAIDKKL